MNYIELYGEFYNMDIFKVVTPSCATRNIEEKDGFKEVFHPKIYLYHKDTGESTSKTNYREHFDCELEARESAAEHLRNAINQPCKSGN